MGTKNDPGAHDCYAAAHPDEPMFILLGRDPVAPLLVRLWAELRGEMTKGLPTAQRDEAVRCSDVMHEWARDHGKTNQLSEARMRLVTFAKRAVEQGIHGYPAICPECGGDFYDGREHAPTGCNNSAEGT